VQAAGKVIIQGSPRLPPRHIGIHQQDEPPWVAPYCRLQLLHRHRKHRRRQAGGGIVRQWKQQGVVAVEASMFGGGSS
jgi:hypothetical protein